jgi:hypothetical protein
MKSYYLLYTSSSYGRLWIYLQSFIPAYVLHIFFSFLSYFIYTKLYTLTHCEVEGLLLSENRISMFMFLEEPDDGRNRPKLVAQISK